MSAFDSLSSSSSTQDIPDGGGPPHITYNDQDLAEDTVSEETIGAALDEYVSASKGGRQAFARGDIPTAMTEFSQALDIELQTEMDCLYDNSIGFVSGLVRRGVDSRLDRSPRHQTAANCAKILNKLMEIYDKANKKMDSKPTQARWYLQMGAALCIINEWEKAKVIYAEGINMCKDKKDLKHALKQLTQIEQITSSAEIPDEDGGGLTTSQNLKEKKNGVAVKSSPRHSPRHSPRQSPSVERRAKRKVQRDRALSTAVKNRSNSESTDDDAVVFKGRIRKRSGSLTLPASPIEHRGSDPALPVSSLTVHNGKKDKRFSLNVFSNKRNSFNAIFGTLGKNTPVPTLSPDERQAWMECFSPVDCKVVSGYREFVPSAVTHMRRLASLSSTSSAPESGSSAEDDGTDSHDSLLAEPHQRMSFSAVKFTSMKIDSDDSELDDD